MAIAEKGGGRHEDATQRLFIELACCELRGSAAELSRLRTALSGSGSAATGPLQALERDGGWPGIDVKNKRALAMDQILSNVRPREVTCASSSWPPGMTALLWVSRRAQG
jgi:hypothetical protein